MRALEGVRVLELAFYYPGPLCGLLLSDLGAEVIKIESPDGDPMRGLGAEPGRTMGPSFRMLNRGKKSVVVDLKTEEGRKSFLGLVARCDVLLTVLRPEVMQRLGVGRAEVLAVNKRLVHCLITGYGATGPYAGKAGHDINYESIAGVTGLSGTPEGRLVAPPVPAADVTGALFAAVAICGALAERSRTGQGRLIDVSLAESAVVANALNLLGANLVGEEPGPAGLLLNGRFPAYGLYRSRDGKWFSLGAIEPKFWMNFLTAAGREDLAGLQFDPAGVQAIRDLFAARDAEFWDRVSGEADACLERVLALDEVMLHPQHSSRGLFAVRDAGSVHVPFPGLDPPCGDKLRVPDLGEDTGDVLAMSVLPGSQASTEGHNA